MQTITSEQALRKAFWTIKLPSMICFFGPFVIFLIWANSPSAHGAGIRGLWYFIAAILGGFILSWLVWSCGVPRWRLWAYQRVADIETLKREAEAAQLLWPEGHFLERTELSSKGMRQRITQLERESSDASSAA